MVSNRKIQKRARRWARHVNRMAKLAPVAVTWTIIKACDQPAARQPYRHVRRQRGPIRWTPTPDPEEF